MGSAGDSVTSSRPTKAASATCLPSGKTDVQVVIDRKDAAHSYLPCSVGSGCRRPRQGRDGLSRDLPAFFCLANQCAIRISAAYRGAVCPAQGIRVGSTSSRGHTRDFKPNPIPRSAPLSRRDAQAPGFVASVITPFILLAAAVIRRCNRVEDASDGAGAAACASCCRHLETASVAVTRDDGAGH